LTKKSKPETNKNNNKNQKPKIKDQEKKYQTNTNILPTNHLLRIVNLLSFFEKPLRKHNKHD